MPCNPGPAVAAAAIPPPPFSDAFAHRSSMPVAFSTELVDNIVHRL